MLLCDINPFIRFAYEQEYAPRQRINQARDYRLFYIVSDNWKIVIDNIEYDTPSGCLLIIPPGCKYHFFSKNQQEYLRSVLVNFDFTQGHNHIIGPFEPIRPDIFEESLIFEKATFSDVPLLNAPTVVENTRHLKNKLDELIREYNYKKRFYIENSSALLKSIIIETVRCALSGAYIDRKANEIIRYIHSHFGENITNDRLGEIIGYHPYHLNRLMKNATGTTLHQYLIDYRMEMAKRFLSETDQSVSHVSELCGYSSLSNFSSDFKKKTGLTATEYIKKVRMSQ